MGTSGCVCCTNRTVPFSIRNTKNTSALSDGVTPGAKLARVARPAVAETAVAVPGAVPGTGDVLGIGPGCGVGVIVSRPGDCVLLPDNENINQMTATTAATALKNSRFRLWMALLIECIDGHSSGTEGG